MDYYQTLGVSKNASPEELKKAYKKQSMQYHPDRPGGNEEKFKEINEAYNTLKDPQKRAQYDNPQTQYSFNSTNVNGFDDIFSAFGFNPFGQQRQRFNPDVTIGVRLTLEEAYSGKNLIATFRLKNGKEEVVEIGVPAGARHGQKIRYIGLGEYMPNNQRGNLYVMIEVMKHSRFELDRNDLYTITKVDIFDFITGGTTEVKNLEGNRIKIKIPEGTQPGARFSVTGHGWPDIRARERKGNLIVQLEATMPKNLTDDEKVSIWKIKKRLAKK